MFDDDPDLNFPVNLGHDFIAYQNLWFFLFSQTHQQTVHRMPWWESFWHIFTQDTRLVSLGEKTCKK